MTGFYSTLFSVYIAILGVAVAVFFVFCQIIISNYSGRQLKFILKDWWLIVYVVLNCATLLLTTLSFYFSSAGTFDIGAHPRFVLFVMGMVLASPLPVFIYFYRNLEYLQPSKMVLLFIKGTDNKSITNYLYRKYGLDDPEDNHRNRLLSIKYTDPGEKEVVIGGGDASERDVQSDMRIYNGIMKSCENAYNPLEPINELTMRSIDRIDISTLDSVRKILTDISKQYLSAVPKTEFSYDWNPCSKLAAYYVDLLIETMDFQMEVCERKKIALLKIKILEVTKCLADLLIETKQLNELPKILHFWKKIADRSIKISPKVFTVTLDYYAKIGKVLINECSPDKEIDVVFGDVGWIGERLLDKTNIEVKPLMYDSEYQTEFDKLMEFVIDFGYEYKNRHSDFYPLVFFDAVIVILFKLIPLHIKNDKNIDLKNRIFDLCYVFFSFSEKAILNKNSEGASLAASRLKESYDALKKNGAMDLAYDCANLLLRLGAIAEVHKEKLGRVGFLYPQYTLNEWIIFQIGRFGYYSKMDHEMKEIYIKMIHDGNHDIIWGYIKKVGKMLNNNFGLNFNPSE